jgi:hypothetical protein
MSDININKIKKHLQNVMDIAKKQGKWASYLIDTNGKVLMIAKGFDQKEVMDKTIDRLKGKDQYNGLKIYEVEIKINKVYIEKQSKLIIGPLRLEITEYVVVDNKPTYTADLKSGAIWYTNEDILNRSFKFKDVPLILKEIDRNDIHILVMGGVRVSSILD